MFPISRMLAWGIGQTRKCHIWTFAELVFHQCTSGIFFNVPFAMFFASFPASHQHTLICSLDWGNIRVLIFSYFLDHRISACFTILLADLMFAPCGREIVFCIQVGEHAANRPNLPFLYHKVPFLHFGSSRVYSLILSLPVCLLKALSTSFSCFRKFHTWLWLL